MPEMVTLYTSILNMKTMNKILTASCLLTAMLLYTPHTAMAQDTPTFHLQARILAAGAAAEGQKAATLQPAEREMTKMLDYSCYSRVADGKKAVALNETFTLTYADGNSVQMTPIRVEENRVQIRIVWRRKEGRPWRKTLSFTRDTPAMIGGPPAPGGGIYLLSITVS